MLFRRFTFHSSAGLFILECSQLPGENSATGHRITCRGLALYNCHQCLLLSTHSHLGGVWEAQIQKSAYWCSPALNAQLNGRTCGCGINLHYLIRYFWCFDSTCLNKILWFYPTATGSFYIIFRVKHLLFRCSLEMYSPQSKCAWVNVPIDMRNDARDMNEWQYANVNEWESDWAWLRVVVRARESLICAWGPHMYKSPENKEPVSIKKKKKALSYGAFIQHYTVHQTSTNYVKNELKMCNHLLREIRVKTTHSKHWQRIFYFWFQFVLQLHMPMTPVLVGHL